MPDRERDRSILEHMLAYCADIEETVQRFGDSYEVFSQDKAYRNACAMCILQIGELAGHLSETFRSVHREMPWNEIRGMRNVMAHAYGSISFQTAWDTVKNDIPQVKAFCMKLLSDPARD